MVAEPAFSARTISASDHHKRRRILSVPYHSGVKDTLPILASFFLPFVSDFPDVGHSHNINKRHVQKQLRQRFGSIRFDTYKKKLKKTIQTKMCR